VIERTRGQTHRHTPGLSDCLCLLLNKNIARSEREGRRLLKPLQCYTCTHIVPQRVPSALFTGAGHVFDVPLYTRAVTKSNIHSPDGALYVHLVKSNITHLCPSSRFQSIYLGRSTYVEGLLFCYCALFFTVSLISQTVERPPSNVYQRLDPRLKLKYCLRTLANPSFNFTG